MTRCRLRCHLGRSLRQQLGDRTRTVFCALQRMSATNRAKVDAKRVRLSRRARRPSSRREMPTRTRAENIRVVRHSALATLDHGNHRADGKHLLRARPTMAVHFGLAQRLRAQMARSAGLDRILDTQLEVIVGRLDRHSAPPGRYRFSELVTRVETPAAHPSALLVAPPPRRRCASTDSAALTPRPIASRTDRGSMLGQGPTAHDIPGCDRQKRDGRPPANPPKELKKRWARRAKRKMAISSRRSPRLRDRIFQRRRRQPRPASAQKPRLALAGLRPAA